MERIVNKGSQLYKMIVLLLFSITAIASVHADNGHDVSTSPMPDLEIGKAKRISKDALPSGLKAIAEEDYAREQAAIDRSTGKRKTDSFEQVGEESLYPKNNYHNHIKPIDEKITQKFKSTPASLAGTDLKYFVYEGFIPEGPTPNGPWSSFTRVFKGPDGLLVMVHEWDFLVDGGGVVVIDELMNTSVNGSPARFVKKQTPSGEVFTELSWITKRKEYCITVWANVPEADGVPYNLAWLKEVARKIR